jgi:hypothetical protein
MSIETEKAAAGGFFWLYDACSGHKKVHLNRLL